MLAPSRPQKQQQTFSLEQLSFSSELKDYKMYLAVFLFEGFEKDVSKEALELAEPLIIYNNSLFSVIDFVLRNRSTIRFNLGKEEYVFTLQEKTHSDVVTYDPEKKELLLYKPSEVFFKILVFHYQQK